MKRFFCFKTEIWSVISTFFLSQHLACIIPYGEPVESYYLMSESEEPTLDFGRWDDLDAQISVLLETEDDRDRIQRLELARHLLIESRTLPTGSQEEILVYIESLLEIEARVERQWIDEAPRSVDVEEAR